MSRIANDDNFECDCLTNMTVEYFSVFYATDNDVLMIVIKVKEFALYQRFFLDTGIGFWEECNQEDTFCDIDDCKRVDFAEELNLMNKKVNSIKCSGSFNTMLSSINFSIGDNNLLLKYIDNDDCESDIIFEHSCLGSKDALHKEVSL